MVIDEELQSAFRHVLGLCVLTVLFLAGFTWFTGVYDDYKGRSVEQQQDKIDKIE
jgi:C4-dicarboxylate transporter